MVTGVSMVTACFVYSTVRRGEAPPPPSCKYSVIDFLFLSLTLTASLTDGTLVVTKPRPPGPAPGSRGVASVLFTEHQASPPSLTSVDLS